MEYPTPLNDSADEMTQDYRNLCNIFENSVSIKSFELRCQDIIHNKLILNRDYYKSAKSFLMIIKLLSMEPEDRKKLLASLKATKNIEQYADQLTEENRIALEKDLKSIIELCNFRNFYLNTAFLMEMSGYVHSKRFMYNCHKVRVLHARQERAWQNRVHMLTEESNQYHYGDSDYEG